MKKTIVFMSLALLACVAFGAGNFVQDSQSVTYSNGGAAISAGQLVDLGDRYGVAKVDIASNKTGAVQINGVWSFQRAVTGAVANGAAMYYSTATSVTATATADTYLGQAVEAVAVCTALTNSIGEVDKYIKVDINVPERQCIVGTDAQAYDADLDRLALNNGSSLTNIPATALVAGGILPAVDGSGVTNLAAGNLASGDVPSARLTTHGVVVTDYTASGVVLAGTGAGTFEAVAGWSGVVTNISTLGTNTLYIYKGIVTNVAVTP